MADTRDTYRFLAPLIAHAGFRVASVDLRGHGESSTGWGSYTHADTAADLIAVIQTLGGPAVIVGQSFSGGAATIAAATNPELVRAIIEIDPFARPPKVSMAALWTNAHNYRRGALLLGQFVFTGSLKAWAKYLEVAYPGRKPSDWDAWLAALLTNLGEPGRAEAAQKMAGSKAAQATLREAAGQLANLRCPALVVMGRLDSDFPDPEAEAAAIVGLLPAGLARYVMIDGAGHYPHAHYPREVARAVIPFLQDLA
jgi:pimeloyl-ACP methyl ester carboxylesterase